MRHSMLFAAFLLSACVDDGGELARRVEATQAARANYSALALKNYALGNATGQGPLSQVMDGGQGLQSLLCLTDAATRSGYHLSWYQPTGKLPPEFAGELVRALGSVLVARMRGGNVVRMGDAVRLGRSCPLPVLPEGWPVVVMRVTVPASNIASTARMETKAAPCPEGQVGAAVYSRNVSFDGAGKQTAGDWGLLHDTCRVVDEVEATAEPIQRAEPVALAAPFGELLTENMPDNCKRVTILARSGNGDTRAKRFETCDFVEVAELEEPALPPVGPRPPRPLPPPPPPCPASRSLPTMSNAGAYFAALEPIEAEVRTMHATCAPVVVTSEAWWPYYQTFNVEGRAVTRLYHVRLWLSFTATAGGPWIESHWTPWAMMSNLRAFPAAFRNGSEYWMKGDIGAAARVTAAFALDGRSYVPFIGPNTTPALGRCVSCSAGFAPVLYPNDGADPWGNTPTQAANNSGLDLSGARNPSVTLVSRGSF